MCACGAVYVDQRLFCDVMCKIANVLPRSFDPTRLDFRCQDHSCYFQCWSIFASNHSEAILSIVERRTISHRSRSLPVLFDGVSSTLPANAWCNFVRVRSQGCKSPIAVGIFVAHTRFVTSAALEVTFAPPVLLLSCFTSSVVQRIAPSSPRLLFPDQTSVRGCIPRG